MVEAYPGVSASLSFWILEIRSAVRLRDDGNGVRQFAFEARSPLHGPTL
jgi:hypothetical protein